MSNKTKNFIEDRLKSVGLELGLIQDNLKKYKNEFGITGLPKEAELAKKQAELDDLKALIRQKQATDVGSRQPKT